MLELLHEVEENIQDLLSDEQAWKSVFIDYEHPFVERVYRSYGENRVSLHRIHPCEPEQTLFHPHPWPSAMRILDGRYAMGVGFTPTNEAPEVAALVVLGKGDEYEMTHRDGWHFVRPLEKSTFSLMVTGKPWDRWSPTSNKPLGPLSPKQQEELFSFVSSYYQNLK